MKDAIKQATELAENELQEKLVENLKNTIKNLLRKKQEKEKERDELDEEIKLIKQDIDDFKAGRLDKIKERHETNPEAHRIAPINITIINDNHRTNYPTQPWKWNYEVYYGTPNYYISSGNSLIGNGITNLAYHTTTANAIGTCTAGYTTCSNGSTYATFTSGTYDIDGKIINL